MTSEALMDKIPQGNDFLPEPFFVLRTPLLPFRIFEQWLQTAAGADAADDSGTGKQACEDDLRQVLYRLVELPEVREALFLASPAIHDDLDIWLNSPSSERGRRLERTIVRYIARMAGRATPFGLFAGWTFGRTAESTNLRIPGRSAYRRHTRLDMEYLNGFASGVVLDRELRRHGVYFPNSSLYRASGRYHYIFVQSSPEELGRSYRLVAAEVSEYLDRLLSFAAEGADFLSMSAYLLQLVDGLEQEEAESFLHRLVEEQLLVSSLTPLLSGDDALSDMIRQLQADGYAGLRDLLADAQEKLRQLDSAGIGAAPDRYLEIANRLAGGPARPNLARLFQVDLNKDVEGCMLGRDITGLIAQGIDLLRYFARRQPQHPLDAFKRAFAARYGDRSVPLVEALDEESGIGFGVSGGAANDPSPLIRELPFPAGPGEAAGWTWLDTLLLRKLTKALSEKQTTMEIDNEDLAELRDNRAELPDSLAAFVTVASTEPDGRNASVLMHAVTGPSGARLLGRFCHADEALRDAVRRHLEQEESLQPEAVFAEIVYSPEERLGNVVARPHLRAYEIPYLGRSDLPVSRQITIGDLLVSVTGDRIVLHSRRLGKEVIPRMSSAHAFSRRGLPIYRFLCQLQSQGRTEQLLFHWGPLASAPFLPRVVYGRLVLARARWNVTGQELKPLAETTGSARSEALLAWRHKRRLPRFVVLSEYDHELPVDLNNALSTESFLELVKNRELTLLLELFPGGGQLPVSGPEGRFLNELIVPFNRAPDGHAASAVAAKAPDHLVRRSASPALYPPGSEWLYAKIFCSPAVADKVIASVCEPAARFAIGGGAADRWFFIRYGDPEWHVRLRIHGDPSRLLQQVIPFLRERLDEWLHDGRVRLWQLDAYEPEVNRYGGERGIDVSERIFHVDSEAVAKLLQLYQGNAGLDARWRLALPGIDRLLTDLGLQPDEKFTLLDDCRKAFASEFQVDRTFWKRVNERLRHERADLLALLKHDVPADHPLHPGLLVWNDRSERLQSLLSAKLQPGAAADRRLVRSIAPSLIHMNVNRLLRSSQRAHELVLYDTLARLYASERSKVRK